MPDGALRDSGRRQRNPASSSARCNDGTPARSASWSGREPVGQDDRLPGRAHGRQQLRLGHRDRTSSAPARCPKLPASPQHPPSRVTGGPRAAQQRAVRGPADHRGVVAVRLRHDGAGSGPAAPRSTVRAARRGCGRRRAVSASGSAAARRHPRAACRGTTAPARRRGRPTAAYGAASHGRADDRPCRSSCPVVIQVSPQQARREHPANRRRQHRDAAADPGPKGSVNVSTQSHTSGAAAPPAETRSPARRRRGTRQRPAPVDPGDRLRHPRRRPRLRASRGPTRDAARPPRQPPERVVDCGAGAAGVLWWSTSAL